MIDMRHVAQPPPAVICVAQPPPAVICVAQPPPAAICAPQPPPAVISAAQPPRRRYSSTARRAFSLAELMVALVILGLGLLFIAAALPVGIEYTRQTVDMATADAAGEYAVQQLEMTLRTSNKLFDPQISLSIGAPTQAPIRLSNIFRPRAFPDGVMGFPDGSGRVQIPVDNVYEPRIKVRPLSLGNIRADAPPSGGTRDVSDHVESGIIKYIDALAPPKPLRERDFYDSFPEFCLNYNPALPGLARVYPPTSPVSTLDVYNFFNNLNEYPTYQKRMRIGQPFNIPGSVMPVTRQEDEFDKTLDRRVSWTALYRRISYDFSDPSPTAINGDETATDPLLYELIIIITQRPTVNHKFPRQDYSLPPNLVFEKPQARNPNTPPADDALVGTDRIAPTPWLVFFDTTQPFTSPILTQATDYVMVASPTDRLWKRILLPTFSPPPTLTFKCQAEVGALLPVGSVFIPAVNDSRYFPPGHPELVPTAPTAGFTPSAPESMPIYKVIDRPDDTTVVVENNGLYPWLATGLDASAFPVWVIPPSFVERDSSGQPVYEDKSPIIKIVRRTIQIPEIP